MIKTNIKNVTKNENVSYTLKDEIANEFEKYLRINGILSYVIVKERDTVFIVDKKHADKADEFFA